MANNSLPTNAAQLIGLGVKMLAGLTSLGSTLKITQITPAAFQAELNAFVTGNGDFNAARSAKQAAYDAFKPADAALSDWLQTTRNVLAARFGTRWSTLWAQAGFIDNSTAVPRRIEERLGLALSLANFFTLEPSYEVASLNVTAAQAVALRSAALSTQQAVMAAEMALKTKGAAYDTVYGVLVSTMRSLIKILGATLENNDPRWLAFGLEMPSMIRTPGQPVNVVDAVSAPTSPAHETHTVTWNCTDTDRALVPDGAYRVRLELAEAPGTNVFDSIELAKGPKEADQSPPDHAHFAGKTVRWLP